MRSKRALSNACNTGPGHTVSIRLCFYHLSLDVRPPAYLLETHLDPSLLIHFWLSFSHKVTVPRFTHDYGHLTTRSMPPPSPHLISFVIFATVLLSIQCVHRYTILTISSHGFLSLHILYAPLPFIFWPHPRCWPPSSVVIAQL